MNDNLLSKRTIISWIILKGFACFLLQPGEIGLFPEENKDFSNQLELCWKSYELLGTSVCILFNCILFNVIHLLNETLKKVSAFVFCRHYALLFKKQ